MKTFSRPELRSLIETSNDKLVVQYAERLLQETFKRDKPSSMRGTYQSLLAAALEAMNK